MINAQTISKMKKGVIIINTSRGGLVDTEALISALESGHVGGVGLDTVECEEGICHNDIKTEILDRKNFFYLKQFPNVVYTPHIGFFTSEAVYQMTKSAFKGIDLCEKGEENRYIVK
jgi:D-lactate dehydrogenase